MHAANHSTIAHHALRRSSTLIYSYAFDNHTSSIKQLVPAGGVWCGHRPCRECHRRQSGQRVHQGLHIYVQQRHSSRRHLCEVIKGIMHTYYGTSTCIRLGLPCIWFMASRSNQMCSELAGPSAGSVRVCRCVSVSSNVGTLWSCMHAIRNYCHPPGRYAAAMQAFTGNLTCTVHEVTSLM